MRSLQAYSLLSSCAFYSSASTASSSNYSSSNYSPLSSPSSSSSSAISFPSNLPINSSLCFNFSLRTAFCFKMLSFSFIMFSSRHFMVSISSCIFYSYSSRRADFCSASWIYFSRYYTWTLISSNWLCFYSASRGQPRAYIAWRKRGLRMSRLMMLPPLRSWIFLTLVLTLASNALICTSYSCVSNSTFSLKALSCPSFSSDNDLFSVSSSICRFSTCSYPEVIACRISFCFEFSSTIFRFISERFLLDSQMKRPTSTRSLAPPRCYQNWAIRCLIWAFSARSCSMRLALIKKQKIFEQRVRQNQVHPNTSGHN